ncbi:MAG: phytanoyl-CoA dioxygenase family protein [Candidatus Promineifilaceae bacterium]|nr:phytanoyl-CoA dioxygenase family protein [Candidatus Promineifilaceae bacterium]
MDRSIPVTRHEIESFQRDGAICLRQKFDQEWLDLIADGIERNLAAPSEHAESLSTEESAARFFSDYCNWRDIPEFREFVYHSPAAEIVARLMGSDKAIFYHDHLLIKEPGTQRRTPWHHDQPYYPVNGRHMCSLWLPLDPVPLETSLQFVKGSHAWGRWFVPRKFATSRDYALKEATSNRDAEGISFESVPDIEGHPEEYEIISWELNPGDCVVFHGMTLHGAAGNQSQTTARRALSTRWFGDDARFAERPWEISPPITGGLKPGEPMACDTFPVIWEKAD